MITSNLSLSSYVYRADWGDVFESVSVGEHPERGEVLVATAVRHGKTVRAYGRMTEAAVAIFGEHCSEGRIGWAELVATWYTDHEPSRYRVVVHSANFIGRALVDLNDDPPAALREMVPLRRKEEGV